MKSIQVVVSLQGFSMRCMMTLPLVELVALKTSLAEVIVEPGGIWPGPVPTMSSKRSMAWTREPLSSMSVVRVASPP